MTMLLDPLGALFDTPRRQPRVDRARAFSPAADVVAGEDEVTLVMDVPGMKRDDLEIELLDDMLRIRGERRYPYASEHEGRTIQRLGRGYGRFERLLQVPKGIDPTTLSAAIEDGVLTLRIPMPEAHKPHRIEVRSGDAQRVIDAEWSTEGGHQDDGEGQPELATAGA